MAKILKITQKKSFSGKRQNQIKTMHALGLRGIRKTVQQPDNDAIRGMVKTVKHMVYVEEL